MQPFQWKGGGAKAGTTQALPGRWHRRFQEQKALGKTETGRERLKIKRHRVDEERARECVRRVEALQCYVTTDSMETRTHDVRAHLIQMSSSNFVLYVHINMTFSKQQNT